MRKENLGELIANAASHGVGVGLSVFALAMLILRAEGAAQEAIVAVFPVSLLLLYSMSTLYHAFPTKLRRTKSVFRRLDHSAIYLLIAGTYTPFVWFLVPTAQGYALLVVLWTIATTGIVFTTLWVNRFLVLHVAMYLLMGWSVVFLWSDVHAAISPVAFTYLIAGGISYTAGIAFYAVRLRFFHFIWHIFVLGGSLLHIISVYHLL